MNKISTLIITILFLLSIFLSIKNERLQEDNEFYKWQANEFSEILKKHKIEHGWG